MRYIDRYGVERASHGTRQNSFAIDETYCKECNKVISLDESIKNHPTQRKTRFGTLFCSDKCKDKYNEY